MDDQINLLLGYSTLSSPLIIPDPEREEITRLILRLAEIDILIAENADLLLVEQVGDIKLTTGRYLDLLRSEAANLVARISYLAGKPILYNKYGTMSQTYSVKRYW